MKNFILILSICCTLTAFGQNKAANLGAMGISDDRYVDIQKSPYLFEEFATAKVYDRKKDITDVYLLNYNGANEEFEFIHNGVKYELDISNYDLITVEKCSSNPDYPDKYGFSSIQFVKGANPNNSGKFQIAVYSNDKVSVYKDFQSKLSERVYTDPTKGKVRVKLFTHLFRYYKVEDGDITELKLNKKNIASILDNENVDSFIKKNKIKLTSEEELKRVMAYYGDLIEGTSIKTATANTQASKSN